MTPQTNLRLTDSARKKIQDICYEARVGPSAAVSAALDLATVEGVVAALRASGEAGRPGSSVVDPKASAEQLVSACLQCETRTTATVHPVVWFAVLESFRDSIPAAQGATLDGWVVPTDPRFQAAVRNVDILVTATQDLGPLGWIIQEPT